jgi:3-oxoacyl-[acyl-carrier protein] reductase
MADFLLNLAANPRARQVVSTLGLPLPMPQRLERDPGPWKERPLHNRDIVVGGAGTLIPALADLLTTAGANPFVAGDLQPWQGPGEAWGRPARPADDAPKRPWALVFDATALSSPAELRALYDFFHPRIKSLARSGRLVVLGRPHHGAKTVGTAAAQRALEGFVRSCGREIGRVGATANLVVVDEGAEERLEPVLRFLLSPRSAYVSGQSIHVGKRIKASVVRPVRPLEGKVALVTGAARGIGESIAHTLAREGAKVVVLDRPADAALGADVARSVGGTWLPCDITDDDAPQHIAAFLKEHFGRVDVVVHNAGVTRDKTLGRMKPELWDMTLDVNLGAMLRVTEALEPLLGPNARIVSLSSIAGIAGNVGQTNYAASKAGVIGFVEAMAPRLARKGIAVNGVAPGFIETRLTDAIPVATREVARRLSNLGQGGLPVDIAEVVTFLSSPGAQGLCGQVLRVCGGSYVGA